MISLITTGKNINTRNFSFKAAMDYKEKKAIDNKLMQDSYKAQQKIDGISAIIGLGVGSMCRLANKPNPINKGINAYFATLLTLLTASGIKELTQKVDLGNEEKNKQYEEAKKEELKENFKYSLLPSLAIGAAAATITGIACAAKKVPNKLDKILTAPLITATPAFLVSGTILENKRQKAANKDNTINYNI